MKKKRREFIQRAFGFQELAKQHVKMLDHKIILNHTMETKMKKGKSKALKPISNDIWVTYLVQMAIHGSQSYSLAQLTTVTTT